MARIRLTRTKTLIIQRRRLMNAHTALATDPPIYSKRFQIARKRH